MPHYIAFLRAINVGGHTVKMEALRSLFEQLSFTNVKTFIASGNVLFDSTSTGPATLEKRIEAHLRKALGYEVATFIRTPAEVAAVAAYQCFPASDLNAPYHGLYVGFVASEFGSESKKRLMAFRNEIDDFQTHKREVYWLRRRSESEFSGGVFEKALGLKATFRNMTTVRKIAALYE